MANFFNGLKRSRQEFSDARAKQFSIQAMEDTKDIVREYDRDIRRIKAELMVIENKAYEDPLWIALKRGTDIDIRNDVVEVRYAKLFELRDLLIMKSIVVNDGYFSLPEDEVVDTDTSYETLLGVKGADDDATMISETE